MKTSLSRRRFIGGVANSIATVTVLSGLGSSPVFGASVGARRRILLSPNSPLPVKTAAAELARHSGASVVEQLHSGAISAGDIVLVVGTEIERNREAAAKLAGIDANREWELVLALNDGLVIAGREPRNVCRAALGWIAHPGRETNRLSTYELTDRLTMWDNTMNQMYRFSKGFDRRSHFREIARLGFTGVEINRYADAGYHVRHRRFPGDSYAWYMSYAPALDAFVESSLIKGLYAAAELNANLDDLRDGAALAREFGLEPGFVCYEPRGVNEAIFDRHPELRGSRIDHPGRSLQPRYALDIAHPRVLEHYAESIKLIMREVPELRYFNFWTQDSGSGLPFASKLYFGPNGSYLARTKTMGELAHDFTKTLLDAGRSVNPKFEVIMQVGWEYTEAERKMITAALPKGATFSHSFGGSLFKTPARAAAGDSLENLLVDDRAASIEPYLAMVTSSGHDPEPIIGVQTPRPLLEKWTRLRATGARRMMAYDGIVCPSQSPYNVNQELLAELMRGATPKLPEMLQTLAMDWCEGDHEAARALVEAWNAGNDALEAWPKLNWYHGGVGRTQGRWLTRPLVPDMSKLDARERGAWERCLFPLEWDIARLNISFEGGIRFFEDEEFARVIKASDEKVIPLLAQAVETLGQAFAKSRKRVLEDQRDRYRGMLLCMRTDRNVFELQLASNDFLLNKGDRAASRMRIKAAINAEIENAKAWIAALTESRTNFFRIAESEETPFVFFTPAEDMKRKLDVMPKHIDDEPGPFLRDLVEPKRRKGAFM
jgi:hypothetical protein